MHRPGPFTRWLHRLAPAFVLAVLAASCGGNPPARTALAAPKLQATPLPSVQPETQETPPSRGFFHEVSSPTATLYILGSVHVGNAELFPMEEPIEEAFEEASALVLEIDLSEAGKAEAEEAMDQTRYPEGQSLSQSLDEQTLALLKKRLDALGVPLSSVNHLRPWVVAMTLVMIQAQRSGYQGGDGVDVHFAERAVKAGKKIVGLETAEQQLNLFTNMSAEAQALMLRQMLESLDETGPQIKQALEAWKTSNEAALLAALVEPVNQPEYQDVYQAVIVQRNEKMADALNALLRGKGTYFAVIGAAHVVGPDGIVERLRRAGHQVAQR